MSLSNPSTASPLCDGDRSCRIFDSPAGVASSPRSQLRDRRTTVAGGLLSCIGDPSVRGGVRCDAFTRPAWSSMGDRRVGRSGVCWEGVELRSAVMPIRGVRNCEGVVVLRRDTEGEEKAESEIRGHLRLCASSSDTRRSIWWSVTLRIAVCSRVRRSVAFWCIVSTCHE